jgi:hypothetical protein
MLLPLLPSQSLVTDMTAVPRHVCASVWQDVGVHLSVLWWHGREIKASSKSGVVVLCDCLCATGYAIVGFGRGTSVL